MLGPPWPSFHQMSVSCYYYHGIDQVNSRDLDEKYGPLYKQERVDESLTRLAQQSNLSSAVKTEIDFIMAVTLADQMQ